MFNYQKNPAMDSVWDIWDEIDLSIGLALLEHALITVAIAASACITSLAFCDNVPGGVLHSEPPPPHEGSESVQ